MNRIFKKLCLGLLTTAIMLSSVGVLEAGKERALPRRSARIEPYDTHHRYATRSRVNGLRDSARETADYASHIRPQSRELAHVREGYEHLKHKQTRVLQELQEELNHLGIGYGTRAHATKRLTQLQHDILRLADECDAFKHLIRCLNRRRTAHARPEPIVPSPTSLPTAPLPGPTSLPTLPSAPLSAMGSDDDMGAGIMGSDDDMGGIGDDMGGIEEAHESLGGSLTGFSTSLPTAVTDSDHTDIPMDLSDDYIPTPTLPLKDPSLPHIDPVLPHIDPVLPHIDPPAFPPHVPGPGEPGYVAPHVPGPGEPGYVAPHVPGPGEPGYVAPHVPGPGEPGYVAPHLPGPGEPANKLDRQSATLRKLAEIIGGLVHILNTSVNIGPMHVEIFTLIRTTIGLTFAACTGGQSFLVTYCAIQIASIAFNVIASRMGHSTTMSLVDVVFHSALMFMGTPDDQTTRVLPYIVTMLTMALETAHTFTVRANLKATSDLIELMLKALQAGVTFGQLTAMYASWQTHIQATPESPAVCLASRFNETMPVQTEEVVPGPVFGPTPFIGPISSPAQPMCPSFDPYAGTCPMDPACMPKDTPFGPTPFIGPISSPAQPMCPSFGIDTGTCPIDPACMPKDTPMDMASDPKKQGALLIPPLDEQEMAVYYEAKKLPVCPVSKQDDLPGQVFYPAPSNGTIPAITPAVVDGSTPVDGVDVCPPKSYASRFFDGRGASRINGKLGAAHGLGIYRGPTNTQTATPCDQSRLDRLLNWIGKQKIHSKLSTAKKLHILSEEPK